MACEVALQSNAASCVADAFSCSVSGLAYAPLSSSDVSSMQYYPCVHVMLKNVLTLLLWATMHAGLQPQLMQCCALPDLLPTMHCSSILKCSIDSANCRCVWLH